MSQKNMVASDEPLDNHASNESEPLLSKQTPRSDELQDALQKRLNRAIGQLNGVKRMIDQNRYCGDVLTQLAAVESAIGRISDMVLKEHLETCVSDRIKAGDESAIEEVMGLLRQHNK